MCVNVITCCYYVTVKRCNYTRVKGIDPIEFPTVIFPTTKKLVYYKKRASVAGVVMITIKVSFYFVQLRVAKPPSGKCGYTDWRV